MTYPYSTIFLIDDHKVVLDGLNFLLSKEAEFKIVGKASTQDMAIQKLKSLNEFPDIIICDYKLAETTGLEVIKEIIKINADFKFIFLTMVDNFHVIQDCWDFGCDGFISKSVDATILRRAIKTVVNGNRFISSDHLNIIKRSEKIKLLSQRETEILEYIKSGHSSKEISNLLYISKRTVDNHRFNILRKYNCKNTIQLLSKYKIEEIAF